MAFFAQTGPSAEARLAEKLGTALGQGVGKNFVPPEQLVQQNRLSESINKIPQNASMIDTLKAIGPQMMTTPQGAQLLEALLQMQQKEALAKSLSTLYQPKGGQSGQPTPQNLPITPEEVPTVQRRGAKVPKSEFTPFPKRAILPEPAPIPTADEQQQMLHQVLQTQMASGAIPDPVAAENIVNQRIQRIRDQNKDVEEQRLRIRQAQDKNIADSLARAQAEDLLTDPMDRAVFEQAANEAREAENPNDVFKYAREKTNQFKTVRNDLTRQLEIPGLVDRTMQKLGGSYKEKQQVIDDIQPQIQKLIDMGYRREARAILTDHFGLGPEDAERTMFPLTDEQKKLYSGFPSSPKPIKTGPYKEFGELQKNVLSDKQFQNFKGELEYLLSQDPEANLIALRGDLINKGYTWQDISKGINQLINDGQFDPDPIQLEQLPYIKASPLPGLAQEFRLFWKGTK